MSRRGTGGRCRRNEGNGSSEGCELSVRRRGNRVSGWWEKGTHIGVGRKREQKKEGSSSPIPIIFL